MSFFLDASLEILAKFPVCLVAYSQLPMVVGLRRNGAASPAEKQNCVACRSTIMSARSTR